MAANSRASKPDAIIHVYAARVGRWRGIFAHHTWVVIKDKGAPVDSVMLPYTTGVEIQAALTARAKSKHPAAARLFLDFLLSRSGQRRLAEHHITPARSDVIIPAQLQTPAVPLRAIRVGPALLVTNDRLTRSHFLALWRQSLSPSTL